ncbi:hypothetical protein GCM10025788_25670 [Serinicoccus chungangensis]
MHQGGESGRRVVGKRFTWLVHVLDAKTSRCVRVNPLVLPPTLCAAQERSAGFQGAQLYDRHMPPPVVRRHAHCSAAASVPRKSAGNMPYATPRSWIDEFPVKLVNVAYDGPMFRSRWQLTNAHRHERNNYAL